MSNPIRVTHYHDGWTARQCRLEADRQRGLGDMLLDRCGCGECAVDATWHKDEAGRLDARADDLDNALPCDIAGDAC